MFSEDETGLPVPVKCSAVEFPVDPTTTDASAEAVLRGVNTPGLLTAALQVTDIDADASWERDRLISELSPVDRERLANEIRYAAPRTIHYFRLSGLEQLTTSTLEERLEDTSYGAQLHAIDELFERNYLIFSVPDSGTQSQLSVSGANRHTTVASFDPGSNILAVRAPTPESAEVTSGKLIGVGPIESATRLDFLEPEFLSELESNFVRGYHRLTLGVSQETAHTDQIELSSDEPATADLLQDDVARSLLDRPDVFRIAGRGVLDVTDCRDNSDPSRPTVDIDYTNGVIEYRTVPSESTMVSVDRAIQSISNN